MSIKFHRQDSGRSPHSDWLLDSLLQKKVSITFKDGRIVEGILMKICDIPPYVIITDAGKKKQFYKSNVKFIREL